MDNAHKHSTRLPVPDAVAKLVSTRSRTDSDRSEQSTTRSRLRNAIPGASHHHNGDKQGHSHMRAAKESVQSALELRPPINFDQLLRRDKRAASSRRNSGNDTARKPEELGKLQRSPLVLKEHVNAEDVKRAQAENEKREEELRSALQQVEEQGMQSTRELDTTYYILLEKAETLREIVNSMQKLAKEGRSLQDNFHEESTSLQENTTGTINGYQDFGEQEQAIRQLLDKLESYKTRTADLNARLDTAKHRTDICERHILQAQAQRRKRWSIIWALLFALVVAILATLIVRGQTAVLELESDHPVETDVQSPLLRKLKTKTEDAYLQDLFADVS